MKYILSYDKTKIAYDICRKYHGAVLILLHGAGGNSLAWKKEIKFLQSKHLSYCSIDLRGHGLSERPAKESQYHLSCFAKDIKAVIDREKIKKFVLVGHCFGGMVAIQFAKLFPQLPSSYILIDTTYKAPEHLHNLFHKHPMLKRIINYRLEKVKIDKNFVGFTDYSNYVGTGDLNLKRIAEDISHTTLKSWFFIYENIAEFDGRSTLKNIKKPVLIIEGNKDKIFSTQIAQKIHSYVKNSEYIVIPDANHVLVINNDKQLGSVIHQYILDKKLI